MSARTTFGLLVLAVSLTAGLAPTAALGGSKSRSEKCDQVIARATGAYLADRVAVLGRCERLKVQGILSTNTDCLKDGNVAAELEGVAQDLEDAIGRACGGADHRCGTADDAPLSATGWAGVAQCPDFELSGCTNAIGTCADVATCVECVADEAADQAIELDFAELNPSAFGTKSDVNACQLTIGKATTKYLQVAARVLGKCWASRLSGKGQGDCPDLTGRKAGLLAKADQKKRDAICKACGGKDKTCGTSDDLSLDAIGFETDCPDVVVPSGGSCGGAILGLGDVVNCVDCVAQFKAECVTAIGAPGATAAPPQCTGNVSCGNGRLDPGEECDPGSTDGAFPGSPDGSFRCPAGETCSADCRCVGGGLCGNGRLDLGEQCDPGSSAGGAFPCPGGETCTNCQCGGGTTTTTICNTATTTTSTTTTQPCNTSTTAPASPSAAFVDRGSEGCSTTPARASSARQGREGR